MMIKDFPIGTVVTLLEDRLWKKEYPGNYVVVGHSETGANDVRIETGSHGSVAGKDGTCLFWTGHLIKVADKKELI